MVEALDVLALTAGVPDVTIPAGQVVIEQDADDDRVLVLVSGRLAVDRGGAPLPDVATPGAIVGEVSALLGEPRTASVRAAETCVVRIVDDLDALLELPGLSLEIARQLAARLHRLSSYLGDVREQFKDEEGHLGMLDTLLQRIGTRAPVTIDPGSDRSGPDY